MSILPEESLSDTYRLFDQPCPIPQHADDLPFAEPSIDLVETLTSFEVIVDLPGVKREDISVDCIEGALTIVAKVSRERQTQDSDTFIHRERHQGLLKRTVSLGNNIDTREVYARHRDGVLEIFIPKHLGQAETEHHIPVT